jgi:hypothetical protein
MKRISILYFVLALVYTGISLNIKAQKNWESEIQNKDNFYDIYNTFIKYHPIVEQIREQKEKENSTNSKEENEDVEL